MGGPSIRGRAISPGKVLNMLALASKMVTDNLGLAWIHSRVTASGYTPGVRAGGERPWQSSMRCAAAQRSRGPVAGST
jgi:hypothetical protein